MIAIDNISRNQIVYVNTDGHANFTGSNGSGKTSTLRASLLFFGSRPGEIAKAKGDTFEGFAKFYFPKPTSYLVYEYQRSGETLCVVCSESNGQVQYQFMNTAFDEALFLYEKDKKNLIASTAQLRINVESKGFELTRKVGPDVYASIIQSNMPYRSKQGSYQIIRDLRPRYSLPINGKSIVNIDRVLSNVFSSKASIAHIQSALTDILIQDNLIPSRILKLEGQSTNINEWFESRAAWLSLDARRDNIITLSEVVTRYHSTHDQLSALYHRCQSLFNKHTASIEKLRNDIETSTNKMSEERSKLTELITEINNKKIEFNGRITDLSSKISALDVIKREFEEGTEKFQSIGELKELHGQLDILQRAEVNAESDYNKVSTGVSDIVSFYETKLAKIQTSIAELQALNQSQLSEYLSNKYEEINELRQLYEKKENGIVALNQQRTQNIQNEIVALGKKEAKIEAQLVDVSFSPDFRESIESIEAEIKAADKDFTAALNENRELESKRTQQEKERTKVVEQATQLRVKRQRQIDRQNTLRKRLENGTLFDFLQESVPEFENTIGKVINPILLDMKGLSPSFEATDDSIYGLRLDIEGLETPTLLNKNELHTELMSLDDSIVKTDEEIKKTETILGKHNDIIKQLKGDLARSNIDLTESQRYLVEQKKELEAEKDKAAVELKSRHENLTLTLRELRAGQVELNNKKRQTALDSKNELATLNAEKNQNEAQIESKYKKNIIQLKDALVRSLAEKDSEKKALLTKKDKDIQEKGLSPERINQAKADYEKAKAIVRRSRSAGERVARYEKFLTQEWVNHHSLSLELEQIRQEQSEFDIKASTTGQEQKNKVQSIQQCIEDMDNDIKQLSTYRQSASELNDKFDLLGIEIDPSKEDLYKMADINECQIKYNKLKADHDAYIQRGVSEFNILEKTFCKTTGTPTRNFYETMRKEVLATHPSRDFWCLSAPILAQYIENEHISQAELLRSNYILVAKKIADFSELISATHKSLNGLGKKLTATTKGVVARFDAIGDIEITVTSKLQDLSYFSALRTFSTAHEDWVIHNITELPDDALISKLTNLINMIGSEKLHIDVDKSFQFEVVLADNGKIKRARTDEEIELLSSTGLSYLIITAIYIGLINLLRTDPNINLLFCVDEIGKLSKENTGKLIALFEEHRISMFSALPDASPELLQHYPYAYEIEKNGANSRTYSLYGGGSRISTTDKINTLLSKK